MIGEAVYRRYNPNSQSEDHGGKFSRIGGKCGVLPREICAQGQLSEVRASTEEIPEAEVSRGRSTLWEKKEEGLNFLTKEATEK